MADTIKVAIADDQKLFLRGLRLIMEDFQHLQIVLEAHNGQELLDKLAEHHPDVILLDLKMPVMDGMEATERIRELYPDVKVILLTMHDDERLISHMMSLGANGYLLKDEEPAVVREAVETVYAKGMYFNEYVSKALLQGMKSRHKHATVDDHLRPDLSPRELQVLELICKEYTTAEIAEALFISTRTVDGHRRNLQEKTGVRNLAGLVMYAVRNGLVTV